MELLDGQRMMGGGLSDLDLEPATGSQSLNPAILFETSEADSRRFTKLSASTSTPWLTPLGLLKLTVQTRSGMREA